ncbi:uncharacterized protein LOC107274597 [Cephus cinctus]|uniref:Uncharacterized protein LOC107274597 n=1 Tax=Cephus cinctus TaxID=211228 RepID=A0AAJ7CFK7_CEPCN|nr:uncharacterized protein LOC107274597 [Cephus cinctus]
MDDKSENPFAPQPADEMAKKGIEVPSIFGYNSHEGIMFLVGATDETYSKVENDFDDFFDKLILNQNITKTDDAVKSVRKYYFGEEPITPEQRDNFIQLVKTCLCHPMSEMASKVHVTEMKSVVYCTTVHLIPSWNQILRVV